jgi:hypothetical protein
MESIQENPFRPTSQDEFETKRIGKMRERMFLHAWRTSLHSHEWLRSVREANRKEDYTDHIDAFLILTNGDEIAIQIKGTAEAARLFTHKWNPKERGIVVVVIGDDYSNEEIIFSTMLNLEMCQKRLSLGYSTVHELKKWRFLETWKDPTDPPSWFRSIREPTSDEALKYGCDAILCEATGAEFPVIIAHDIKGIRSAFVLEVRDGILRLSVLVQSIFTKNDIRLSTITGYDALKVRESIGRRERF